MTTPTDISPQINRRIWRRHKVLLLAGLLLAAAGIAALVAVRSGTDGTATGGVVDNAYPTSVATVRRQTLTATIALPATLGYAGSYTVLDQFSADSATGTSTSTQPAAQQAATPPTETYTALPPLGDSISDGRPLYRVNQVPVVLLYGRVPAYRSLSEGVIGADVAQLNADLVALGYATRQALDPSSDEFTWQTAAAVEKLQANLGEAQTGNVPFGQVVFLPSAVRVTSLAVTLGASAEAGGEVLTATSTRRQVSVALDPASQSQITVGEHVTIALPDARRTSGVVSSVGKVATASQTSGQASTPTAGSSSATTAGDQAPTITVLVRPLHPRATGRWDQAAVNVIITTQRARHVLAVPVAALLALAGGGYAVEIVEPGGTHHLAAVSLGLLDDAAGLVQVAGTALSAGQRIVVPTL